MITRIQKWGNSLSIRIPKPFATQLGLSENTPVSLVIENSQIIIKPEKYSLDLLLNTIDENNIHHETDAGNPMGSEIW